MKKLFTCSLLFLLGFTTVLFGAALRKIDCPTDLVPIVMSSCTGLQGSKSKSTHWSGYVAADNFDHPEKRSVDAVAGSWVVPQLSGNPADSSIWVGIDGFTSTAIERIGTDQIWTGASQINFAWFSVLPNIQFPLPPTIFPVFAGDLMSAEVNYIGDGQFLMLIQNITQGWFTPIPPNLTIAHGTPRDTAEWIVEAPCQCTSLACTTCILKPLADFGKVNFTHCYAKIEGDTGFIGDDDWEHKRITMVSAANSHIIKAKPHSLKKDGSSFHVTWRSAGP
jgi:Peptidase A4 family